MHWAIGFLVVINVTIFLWGSLTQGSATKDRRWGAEPTVSGIEVQPAAGGGQTAAMASPVSLLEQRLEATGNRLESLPPLESRRDSEFEQAGPEIAARGNSEPATASQPLTESVDSGYGVFVSEAEDPSVESDQDLTSDPSDLALGSAARLHCGQIGPLSGATEAEVVKARLAEAGLQPILQEVVEPRRKGFWVLIPPLADRDAGNRTLARLKKKGVKDMWLFKRGELNNAISLGLYNRRNNAEVRRKQLESLGFQVEIWPRVESVSRYQVGFSGTGPAVLDQVRLLVPKFESRNSACS